MKRLFSLILSVLLVMMQLTGCGAFDNPPPTCEHEYVSSVTREPTYDDEGEQTYTCGKCGDTYTEEIPILEKHIVPTHILDQSVSYAKYYSSPFSITVGRLVNSAMDNYTMKHYTAEEAFSKGYLKKSQIDSSVDIEYLYCTIISGDTMVNPDIPYLTRYAAEAVKVWTVFDENDELQNYGVELCSDLQTCAILLMTGY